MSKPPLSNPLSAVWSVSIRQEAILYEPSVFRLQVTQVFCKMECLGFDHVCAVRARSSSGLALLLFQDTIGSNEVIYANVVIP